MPFSELRGLGLVLAASIAALWLAANEKLDLYIHPRYIIPTVVFAMLAIILTVFAGAYIRNDKAEASRSNWLAYLSLAACLCGLAGLFIAKPAALTSATASQRGVNAAAIGGTELRPPASSPLFDGNDYSNLSIKDWSALLSQTSDPEFFNGKTVVAEGFIVPDERDRDNVFYVSRFIVTCCAVDARPVGLPVYKPGWRASFKPDQWVRLEGAFTANPSPLNQQPAVVVPGRLQVINEPERTYDY